MQEMEKFRGRCRIRKMQKCRIQHKKQKTADNQMVFRNREKTGTNQEDFREMEKTAGKATMFRWFIQMINMTATAIFLKMPKQILRTLIKTVWSNHSKQWTKAQIWKIQLTLTRWSATLLCIILYVILTATQEAWFIIIIYMKRTAGCPWFRGTTISHSADSSRSQTQQGWSTIQSIHRFPEGIQTPGRCWHGFWIMNHIRSFIISILQNLFPVILQAATLHNWSILSQTWLRHM